MPETKWYGLPRNTGLVWSGTVVWFGLDCWYGLNRNGGLVWPGIRTLRMPTRSIRAIELLLRGSAVATSLCLRSFPNRSPIMPSTASVA